MNVFIPEQQFGPNRLICCLSQHMKKFLTAILSLSLLVVAARAESFDRKAVLDELDSCEAIIRELQGNSKTAIPADILRRARGIIIVNQFQGSFILGIKDGYAVA